MLLLPSVVYLLVFIAYPMFQGVRLAFTSESGAAGFSTIHQMFTDTAFVSSITNTLILLGLLLPVQFALAIVMALMVNSRVKGSGLWLYIYMLPLGISELSSGILWYSIFTEQGWLNSILTRLGIIHTPIIWLNFEHPLLIILTIVVAEAWRSTSLIVIILVGGLQGIPSYYGEAAEVFYATPWQKFWHVTVPLLRPALRTALILRTVLAFEVFATVVALAGSSLDVLATKANESYTQFQEPHLAAAYGVLIMLFAVVSTALILVLLPVRREQLA